MKALNSLTTSGIIMIALPAFLQIILIGYLCRNISNNINDAREAARSKEILLSANALVAKTESAITSAVTSSFFGKEEMDEAKKRLNEELSSFRTLTEKDAEHQANRDKVQSILEEIDSLKEQVETASEDLDKLEGQLYRKQLKAATRLEKLLADIIETEAVRNSKKPYDNAGRRALIRQIMICFLIESALVALAMTLYCTRTITGRLKQTSDNTNRMSRREPLAPALTGGDEIAQFDRFLHQVDAAITEAMKKEKTLIESAADMIVSLDSNFVVVSANPAVHQLLQHEIEQVIGRAITDIMNDEQKTEFTRNIENVSTSTDSGFNFECGLLKADGSTAELLWSAQWSQRDEAFFCVIHDITEAKDIERLKESFVQMVSHDLRSPLMSISGSFELLTGGAHGKLPDTAIEELNSAESNVRRLIDLINDLLDMEKLRSGKMQLHLAPCDVSTVIQRAIDSVRSLAQSKGIAIAESDSRATHSATPAETLVADQDKLVQVLINFLGNAIKFSKEGDTITIKTLIADGQLEFQVIDQGPGIDEEHQPMIFKPFEQVAGSGQEAHGSGLGLAICKAIIDAHHGTIGVTSTVGDGSTFWFRLPINDARALQRTA